MKHKLILILILVILLSSGCSYRAQLLEKSQAMLAEGNIDEAEGLLNELVYSSPRFAQGYLYMGFVYLYQDRIVEAVREFETALKYNKEPDLEYLGLGHAYLALGQYEKSKEYLEKARTLGGFPASEYLLGFMYLDGGQYNDARRVLKQVSKAYPDRGEVWAALGKLALENLQTLDAVQAYQMAYVYGLRHFDLYVGLAESYYQMGNFRQAVAVTEQALKEDHLNGKEKEQLQLKLAQYNVNQNPEKAIESFEAILKKNPYKAEVMLMLGQLYYQQAMYQKSVELYGNFLKKYPPLAPVLHQLYNCQLALGNEKLAEKYLKDTIEMKPKTLVYQLELINLYQKQKRWKEVLSIYETALELSPNDVDMLLNVCGVYFELKQYEKAIPYINRAIAIQENNIQLYLTKANIYFRIHDMENERETYEAILLHQPNHLLALTNLAQIYRDEKKYDEALALYQKANKIPSSTGNFDRQVGMIYVLKGEHQNARSWLNKAIAKNVDDYEAYRYIGDTYYAEDQLAKAVEFYQQSLAKKPDYHGVMYPLAKAYFYLNDLAKAKELFTTFQKRYPLNEGCKFYLTRIGWLENQKAPGFKVEPAK